MDPIQHKIVRQQAPAVILRRIGTAALGDAHGLDHWCDRAVYFSLRAARTVPLGDLIDRNPCNNKVIEIAKNHTASGKMIPLWGNHDLMFTLAMRGNMEWALNWLTNGGTSLADEFSLSKRADVIRADIFLALFSEVSEGDYILRPWTRNRPALCKSLFQTVLNNILSNRKLIETAKWMADNMRLYYIDDLGTLYMHSGLKYLLASEKVRNGTASGIQVLKELESELRTALASDTTGCANIFWRMLGKEGFLYSRNIEPGGSFSYDPGDLKRMGVERIVMGHDPLVRVFNVDDKYFFLNLSGNKGVGSFFITPKQIELESSCPDLKIFEKSVIPCQATP